MQNKQNKNKIQIIPFIILFIPLILFFWYFNLFIPAVRGSSHPQVFGTVSRSSGMDQLDYQICSLNTVICPEVGESISVDKHGDGIIGSPTFATITMYTSRIQETDSSPCISADGTNICQYPGNICASNDYKFGTKIKIKNLGTCIIKDRMNKRYTGQKRIDWYAGFDLKRAINFGKQQLEIIVL